MSNYVTLMQAWLAYQKSILYKLMFQTIHIQLDRYIVIGYYSYRNIKIKLEKKKNKFTIYKPPECPPQKFPPQSEQYDNDKTEKYHIAVACTHAKYRLKVNG